MVEGGKDHPARPEDHREDQGLGGSMFLSMKKLIAALMVMGQQENDSVIVPDRSIPDFMANA
jgi:hypothetical protein